MPGKGARKKKRRNAYKRASDVGRIAIPLSAITISGIRRDNGGVDAITGSVAAAHFISNVLKELIPEERPDHDNAESFPSAHTAETVAASIALGRHAGWKFGAPSLLLAGSVGAARVLSRRHHWYDVVAGAGIGAVAALGIDRLIGSRERSEVKCEAA